MFDQGFPEQLKEDVLAVTRLIANKSANAAMEMPEQFVHYVHKGKAIQFPYRIYYADIPDKAAAKLSPQQKMILHCIYSRSHDGLIRQKHLRCLLQMDYEEWAIPYIVKICDEYVVEILEMVYGLLKNQDTTEIQRFCLENKESFCRSYSRMISYWNDYYRHSTPDHQQYVGSKLFRECLGYSKSMEIKVITPYGQVLVD